MLFEKIQASLPLETLILYVRAEIKNLLFKIYPITIPYMSPIWQLSIEELNPLCNISAKLFSVLEKNFLSLSNDLFSTSLLQWFSLYQMKFTTILLLPTDLRYHLWPKKGKSNSCSVWSFFEHLERIWMSSVSQFSYSVVSNSLQLHGLQHARPPCPSPTPGAYLNSCPLSRWCHPTISSSVVIFSSCLQSFLALGSFQISQFFPSGGQSIGVSASTSVLPMNIKDWFPLEWTGWISLQSKGLSRVFSNTTIQKHQFFSTQLSL